MRRVLLVLPLLVGLIFGPSLAAADPLSDWTAGPNGVGDDTYDGFIDTPASGASVPTGDFAVTGWFVDKSAEGWAGADQMQVFLGPMGSGGTMLVSGAVAQSRPDVAAAEGNPYFTDSGFTAVVPAGAVPAGNQTLSVYLHTPAKGWWYKSVDVSVSSSAPAAPSASAPAPVVQGATLPVIAIEIPGSGQTFTQRTGVQMVGYALDPNAGPNQGVAGSGIDRVDVYMDGERDSGGTFVGDAELGFSDQTAARKYGSQFQSAGWQLTFNPTNFTKGVHQIFAYGRSAASGKENLALITWNNASN
jgi:Bacterial Ig domain